MQKDHWPSYCFTPPSIKLYISGHFTVTDLIVKYKLLIFHWTEEYILCSQSTNNSRDNRTWWAGWNSRDLEALRKVVSKLLDICRITLAIGTILCTKGFKIGIHNSNCIFSASIDGILQLLEKSKTITKNVSD